MPIGVNENIFRLEISVDDIQGVDVLDGEDYLGDVEAGLVFFEDLLFVQMVGEVAAWAVVEDHVQVVGGLETVVHFDHVWVRGLLQDVAFGDGVLQVLVPVQKGFLEHFHREFLLGALSPALEDLSEGTVAENFEDVKGLEADSLQPVVEQDDIGLFHFLYFVGSELLALLPLLHSLQLLRERDWSFGLVIFLLWLVFLGLRLVDRSTGQSLGRRHS